MKINIYSIFDKKAVSYNNPFYESSNALAMRSVKAVLSDPHSMLSQFPEDFALAELGSYDSEFGIFETHNPVIIAEISDL